MKANSNVNARGLSPFKWFCVLLVLIISQQDSFALESRVWINQNDGRLIHGTLLETKGTRIVIQRKDGSELALDPGLLIQEDREYIFENLQSLESPINLDSHAVKIDFAWKIGSSKSWSDSFDYYQHADVGVLASEDNKWIFIYGRQSEEAFLYRPPFNYRNEPGDPFSPEDPFKSNTTGSREDPNSGVMRVKVKESLDKVLVERRLSAAGGYVCRYYKYDDARSTLEVWSVPGVHGCFSATLSVGITDIVRKQGYDLLEKNGTHASYKQLGVKANMSKMGLDTTSFSARNYIWVQKEFPMVIKYVHKQSDNVDHTVEMDLLMKSRLIPCPPGRAQSMIGQFKGKTVK